MRPESVSLSYVQLGNPRQSAKYILEYPFKDLRIKLTSSELSSGFIP